MIVFFIGFFCGFLFSIIILSLLFSTADANSQAEYSQPTSNQPPSSGLPGSSSNQQ